MHAFPCLPHVVVRFARGVVPLIVLARRLQPCELVVDRVGRRRARGPRLVRGVEGERRRAAERRAHQHHRPEDVRPRHGAPRRDRRSEVVPDDAVDRAVAERRHQRQHVAHFVERPERREVVVERHVRPRRAAVATQVGREDVIPGGGERRHHPPPAVGELRIPMHQQERPPAPALEAGFEHVHPQPVDVFDETGPDAGGEDFGTKRTDRRRALRLCRRCPSQSGGRNGTGDPLKNLAATDVSAPHTPLHAQVAGGRVAQRRAQRQG